MEEKRTVADDKGIMQSVTWLCDDIKIGYAVCTFKELTAFSASSQADVVRLHLGMRGNYSFTHKQLHKTFDLVGGHHNIMYSKDFDMVVQNHTLELETFGIQFPKDMFIRFTQNANELLKRFSEKIIRGKSAILTGNWGAVDPMIQQVIRQIRECQYGGDLKKLFLLSKSIELLVLSAEACNKAEIRKDLFIKNKKDKEKLNAVRDLINERLDSPPNLSEIAKEVGLNEYKLKRGFKETFHMTVFGYLTEQRLNLAHQYLLDTEKTASEIAFDLGYASPQHFNNAFKKKFGIAPNQLRK